MKKIANLSCFLLLFTFFTQTARGTNSTYLHPSDKFISNIVEGVKYESGSWAHPDYVMNGERVELVGCAGFRSGDVHRCFSL